ncbi:unnamed protein product [Clonostachys rosea]|uniref:Transcription factor domain-containing protein n=1 Tax=Bionectria ochroleuca TaxID=29856 RepID=A0ABY6UU23_BIOOC|nr:unnamed protein product [Clonostachys rosea]
MWLEKTSQTIGPNAEDGPLSYSIFQYIDQAPALIHAIQSFTAGYEHFFEVGKIRLSLEERSMAMTLLCQQIKMGKTLLSLQFLTCWLLGISSTFIDEDVFDIGREHLLAARTMVDWLVAESPSLSTDLDRYVVGVYVYWDLTCSMLVDPSEQLPFINTTVFIQNYISQIDIESHPIIGGHIKLFLLLANLGRHCRTVMDTGCNCPDIEKSFQHSLENWVISDADIMWQRTVDSFVKHGLIMLYRLCGVPGNGSDPSADETEAEKDEARRATIDRLAVGAVKSLLSVPISSSFICLQPIPLLTAGSELSKDELDLRRQVVTRFEALFSYNRLPGNMRALELLQIGD